MIKSVRILLRNPFFRVVFGMFLVMFFGGWFVGRLEGIREITHGINPFWWAIVTMTTVGYGDYYPQTTAGRVLAIFVMYGGILLTAMLTATISSIFVARRIREDKGLEKLDIEGHILLCGWNRSTERLLDSLQSLAQGRKLNIVLINDENEDIIAGLRNKYRGLSFKFVRGDFTREPILERANLKGASSAIILPTFSAERGRHPDERTIFATLTIKTMAPKVRVIAYITERENLTHVRRANVDEVILSDDFGAYMVASHVMDPGVPQTVEALLDADTQGLFRRVDIPPEYVGKPCSELFDYFRDKKGWVLVSVFSEEEHIGIGEILASDTSALDAFIERKLKEAGHTLGEESRMATVVNPGKDYVIRENEKAIVIT
ncbi:MAG: potassium channel family protein [Fidelibacterota bacterium]